MNHTIGLVALLCLAFVVGGCVANNGGARSNNADTPSDDGNAPSDGFDITKIAVGPNNAISWEDAKAIIQYADVKSVMQTHSGLVHVRMRDDTVYRTNQPRVDDVIHWITELGKRDDIGIMTQ